MSASSNVMGPTDISEGTVVKLKHDLTTKNDKGETVVEVAAESEGRIVMSGLLTASTTDTEANRTLAVQFKAGRSWSYHFLRPDQVV